jgi:hypothetical protein
MKRIFILLLSLLSNSSFAQNLPKTVIQPEEMQRSKVSGVQTTIVPLKIQLYVRKTPSREPLWFTSIQDAMDSAQENNYRMIQITVYPGIYIEPLQITRPTSIHGYTKGVIIKGSISNGAGHDLALSNLTLRDCRPYALVQQRGALNLTDVGIYRTRRSDTDSHSGTAIEISEGVVGRFMNVALNDNQGFALFLSGAGTKVLAQNLTVRNNRINRRIIETASAESWMERIAAVEVGDGALLLGDNPVIEDNEFIGLLARDGGRVRLRGGRVSDTQSVEHDSRRWGGINVSSRRGGRIELESMQISGARLAGIQNSSSWFKLSESRVIGNAIGGHIKGNVAPDYDPIVCLSGYGTVYEDNDRNFDSDYLPVPSTGLDEDATPNCPGVPWDF